jgi:acyl-CoA synthetase (AMP-forming)/AMP-acid ligase II
MDGRCPVLVHDIVPRRLRAEWLQAGYYPRKDLYALFADRAAAHPGRTAVIDDVDAVDYARLDAAVGCLAHALAAGGVSAGDVVAMQLPNCWQANAAELAVWAVGGICLPYPTVLREHESRTLLQRSGAVAAVVASGIGGCHSAELLDSVRRDLPALRDVFVVGEPYGDFTHLDPVLCGETATDHWSPRSIDPDGPARILVTSGTEATPKMVVFSHHAMAAGMGNRLATLDPDGMRALLLVPGSTGFGALGTAGVLACHGGTLIVTARFDAARAIALIGEQRPTHLFGVPTMFSDIVASPALAGADTSSVRVIAGGGAQAAESLVAELHNRVGGVFVNRYGAADGAASQTALDDPPVKIATTMGRPDPAVMTLRIVDDSGCDVVAGVAGEIWARGPFSAMCYGNAPELDAIYRTADGWLKTGDLGVFDEDGYLRVVGRRKDVVKRGGVSISPAEIEELLATHPAVLHVACVGMPDQRLGQRVCAYVVPRDPAAPPTLPDLTAALRRHGLATYKLPERLELVSELPRNPVGKTNKTALGERIAATLAEQAERGSVPSGDR